MFCLFSAFFDQINVAFVSRRNFRFFTWNLSIFSPKLSSTKVLVQICVQCKLHKIKPSNKNVMKKIFKKKYKYRKRILPFFPHCVLSDGLLLFLHLLSVGPLSHRIQLNCRLSCSCGPSGLQLCIIPLQPNSFDTHWLTDPIDNIIKSVLDTNRVRIIHLTPPYIFLMCNLKRWKNEINRNVSC